MPTTTRKQTSVERVTAKFVAAMPAHRSHDAAKAEFDASARRVEAAAAAFARAAADHPAGGPQMDLATVELHGARARLDVSRASLRLEQAADQKQRAVVESLAWEAEAAALRTQIAAARTEPRRFIVRTYYGDTLIDQVTITGVQARGAAASAHLTARGDGLVMSDERDDDLTPGATRWTLTEPGTGFPAGGITVAELAEPDVTTCDGCPSTARDTDACPNYGRDLAGAWLCVGCCDACCADSEGRQPGN